MTFDEIRQIALSFPNVEEHIVFGSPTFKIGKRYLAGNAKIDPDTLCIKVPDKREREFFLSTKPEIYYMAEHYANFECLLIRMPLVDSDELRDLFEQAWRTYAPKRLLASYHKDE
jgi:hypothetical protein